MKKLILLPCLMAIPLLFITCRKETSGGKQDLNSVQSEMVAKAGDWLNARLSATSQQRNARIGQLKNSLDFSRLRVEELNKGERFMIIPVDKTFEVGYNQDKSPVTNLLLIVDKTGRVRKGEIVQYIADDPSAGRSVPAGTFHALFNSKPVTANGRFVFLSLFDRHLYEVGYKDGALNAFTVMQPKDKPGAASREGELCIDWYLITTIYYTDGTHETSEEYVGTTSYGSCQPGEKCDQLDGGTGGAPEVVSAQKDWTVAHNTYGLWFVVSNEQFNGVKVPGELGVGHFTGMTHLSSTIVATGSAYIWQQLGATTSFNATIATSIVSGKVSYQGMGDVYIPPAPYQWVFPTVFP
ncbi:MAG: hypothetical protein ABW019_09795 [Chitinophagaceae bacterium]